MSHTHTSSWINKAKSTYLKNIKKKIDQHRSILELLPSQVTYLLFGKFPPQWLEFQNLTLVYIVLTLNEKHCFNNFSFTFEYTFASIINVMFHLKKYQLYLWNSELRRFSSRGSITKQAHVISKHYMTVIRHLETQFPEHFDN